ncbi:MAG: ATP-grasp domain-containing protein, partial [Ktedonobacteraceae bacterium]
ITAKQTTPLPFAVEVGHIVPAPLAHEQMAEIEQLVIAALSALGVTDTVTHTEVKLTPHGPRIIEVNARPGGDKIPRLVQAVTGYDLRVVALYLALGKTLADVPRSASETPVAAIRFLAAEQAGIIDLAEPTDALAVHGIQMVELFVPTGSEVERTTSNYTRLGYVMVHARDAHEANELADEAIRRLAVQIELPVKP